MTSNCPGPDDLRALLDQAKTTQAESRELIDKLTAAIDQPSAKDKLGPKEWTPASRSLPHLPPNPPQI